MTLGQFDGDPYPDLVVGMPRGANLTGKVLFLSGRSMGQLHNVTGSQVKEAFTIYASFNFFVPLLIYMIMLLRLSFRKTEIRQ